MKRTLLLAGLAASAGTVGVEAASAQIAVGVGIGTGGVSAEAQVKIAPWLQLRGGYNYFEYTSDGENFDDITYDGSIDLTSFGAFVDLHPFSNSFVISGGALMFQGDNFLDFGATPTSNVQIGDTTYTPAQVGRLGLTADFEESIAPYIGIGWDTTGGGGIGLKLLLGAAFTGTPSIDITSTGGTLSSDATFQQKVAQEETNANDDIEEYKIIPVVQLGLTFGF